ncbi:hypothetical protein GC175_05495 [bacterium]|nr:hypothetical protein [bacterium]
MLFQRLLPCWFALFVLAGCAAPTPAATSEESATLRVAVLPITDVVPFYVAQQEDEFSQRNLTVELVPVSSGPERDTLLQAGGADCALNEVLGTILFNAGEGEELRVVSTALRAFPEAAHFYLLAAPQSGVSTPADLSGRTIAISSNTIIEYWTDRLLTQRGVNITTVKTTNVPQIPVRLELLMSGQVDAAVLPDPLGSLAILQGAVPILDDTIAPQLGLSVISCRLSVVENQPDAVRALVAGWDAAVDAINADSAQFGNVLIENTRVPEPLQDRYSLPPFPVAENPTPAEVDDVLAWAMEKGLIGETQAYETVVRDVR